ncbi:SDR family oxidoreductase [Uliginosibacterium sp. H3]|uniref:SDR family oxidoreductase n=1 Tax=Uliginosibacterium silvisoli TaxID=3114758 RepID=A0ABU6K7M6_9RHOO|nr:SDR family oxidoreductase [Uliginosibacterium sp. H3]
MVDTQQVNPPQHQDHQPGSEALMQPAPESAPRVAPQGKKLQGKVAIITGGDSGIGRAVSVAFAAEGADIVIAYLDEDADAQETIRLVGEYEQRCVALRGDIGTTDFAAELVSRTLIEFGQIDIVVNNAAEQHVQSSIEDIEPRQLEETFRTNVFAMFYLVRAALPHLKAGASIINTASVTAYRGSAHLLDYSASKGAIVAFTRSLSQQLVEMGIRVNAVAPGPVWTPLIPASFSAEQVAEFGSKSPMKRPGQPNEVAPSYVFLASNDASFMSGQVLHPNGGEVING